MSSSIILGAHDAFTYSEPSRFIDYLFSPFAKCQSKQPLQLLLSGVRCFDIRVRFNEDSKPYACHGLYRDKVDVESEIEGLYHVNAQITEDDNNNQPLYFRLILETSKPDITQETLFKEWCEKLINRYPNANFIEMRSKFNWKRLYTPICKEPQIIQSVGSMANDARWYEKVLPFAYAKRTNKERLQYSKPNYISTTYEQVEVLAENSEESYIILFDFI